VLEVRNLTVAYGSDQVLGGVDLDLPVGDSLVLVGESGTGKTTLGLAIMGLCEGTVKGSIVFKGKDLLRLDGEALRQIRGDQIAMVFQNVNQVLDPVYRVIDQVMEPVLAHGPHTRGQANLRANEILAEVGFPLDRAVLYPHQLSGGEQQRVLLATALANKPDLLILDEPLAAIDASGRTEIISLLRDLNQERGVTLLTFTHDVGMAVEIADRMGSLYAGLIVELGSSESVVMEPRHPYTRALIRSYPNMTTSKDLQGIKGRLTRPVEGCPFHPRCTQGIDICHLETPPLKEHDGRELACHRGGVIPLMRTVGLTKRFGEVIAVDSVDITIHGGETLSLVGPSGAGKTTLARLLMGLLEPTNGTVYLDNQETKVDENFYRRVQMVFQNPGESLSHRLTVLELVREPLDVQRFCSRQEAEDKVVKAIQEVQLPVHPDFLATYPHHLSGGELQRVAIARALVLDPDLLIADEPTSALDPSVQAKILKLLLSLQESRGLSMLFVTHDIAVARKISDRMAVMMDGRIVEQGPLNKILSSPANSYTKALIASAPSLEKTSVNIS
jgi:peptide/nickel transport system ATP-binding protein